MENEFQFLLLLDYCINDNHKSLKEAIVNFEDINKYDVNTGWNLIIVAAFNHSYNCFDILLNYGADINSKNHKGTTVFMYAKTKVFINRNFNFLKKLYDNGADIEVKDLSGKSVLDYVLEKGDIELFQFIKDLKKG
ncbi:ankyrin repeat domain-containing protein [Lacihabitans sp. CS3-21]|uniref:ankyrin repeat domain-containing protein n=1 Tax=Lacihabitans sp. CS3-21 TaxID=2487332 RepID=UPI0020CFB905|nr:ankyrin repeat domain-containing protein [Lacihabitans sp. CS3-21]MCP9747567.1 ankyrin repeat domain-containing protein [Lacihabitans sp. CS3-21]